MNEYEMYEYTDSRMHDRPTFATIKILRNILANVNAANFGIQARIQANNFRIILSVINKNYIELTIEFEGIH